MTEISEYEIKTIDGMDITIHVFNGHRYRLDVNHVIHFASLFDDGFLWDFLEGSKNWFFFKCHMNESED